MEAIKDALDRQFEYLNHLLKYKCVKDQIAIVLKNTCGWRPASKLHKGTLESIKRCPKSRRDNWKGGKDDQNLTNAKKY